MKHRAFRLAVRGLAALVLAVPFWSCTDDSAVLDLMGPRMDLFNGTYQVSGRVTNQAGDPIVGTVVDMLDPATSTVVATATADENGDYAVSVDAGTYNIRVTPPLGSGFQISTLFGRVIAADATIDFMLVPAGAVTLSGRVLDAEGDDGLPDVAVALAPSGGGTDLRTMTDHSGHYSFSVAPGAYRIFSEGQNVGQSFSAPNSYYLQSQVDISLTEDTELDITLPVMRVDVRVQDPAESPVAGVRLTTTNPANPHLTVAGMQFLGYNSYPPWAWATPTLTDDLGNVTLWLIPTESGSSYTFTATPPEDAAPLATSSVSGINVVGATTVTITLHPPLTLSGRVLDAEGDDGLPDVAVALAPSGGGTDLRTMTDHSGHYSFSVAPGAYRIFSEGQNVGQSFSAPNSYYLQSQVDISLTEDTELDITLPVMRVDVRVQDPAESPVAGVRLTTTNPANPHLTVAGMQFLGYNSYPPWAWATPTLTDDLGNVTLWLIPTESGSSYTFTATSPEGLPFGTFHVTDVDVTGDLTMVVVLQFVHDPPVTTATLSPPNERGLHPDPTTVTLSATASPDFWVEGTHYSVDGGSEQLYSDPFQVVGAGGHVLEFWSVDNLGVHELTQTLGFEIVTNQPPVAEAGGPYNGVEGASVALDASGSSDPDENIVLYEWDLDDDGAYDDATGVAAEVTFQDNGAHMVGLKVTDEYGEFDTDRAEIAVSNAAPSVDAGSDATIISGGTVQIGASFTDKGVVDTHTATIDFGDGQGAQPATLQQGAGSGTVTGALVYFVPGTYSVEACVTDDDGDTGCDRLTVDVGYFSVLIDIKPGSDPNSINCTNDNGTITVAILSTATFDATSLDATTVRFGRAQAPVRAVGGKGKLSASIEDSNGDGLDDLVVQFDKADTGIACGDTSATVTGQTTAGVYVHGSDAIRTTPPNF